MLIGSLVSHGFVKEYKVRRIREVMKNMMVSWKQFCALPLEVKKNFVYTGDSGSGYEYKEGGSPTSDRKENFHITIEDYSNLVLTANEQGIGGIRLIENAYTVLDYIRPFASGFCRAVERNYQVDGLEEEMNSGWRGWTLRMLHYPPGSVVGEVIAAPHADKLGLTLYLSETTSGVQYYDGLHWLNVPTDDDHVIITPNMQMQYRTGSQMRALYHKVVANKTTSEVGRYSIVCFCGLPNTPQYDKERCGRMQDHPVGFNYGMPHEEFAKLFT